MIDREKARAAIEDAFADGIKRIYETLVTGLETGEARAGEKFASGLRFRAAARDQALAVVDSFPAG